MTKIKVMSDNLANKIAAGEVIERVSAVVKELVENSLDAKAEVIKVSLKDSGIKEITITDDGVGMDKEDALLAFSRHATSKIRTTEDLFFIETLGFRGEALPSIASVSEVYLKTCSDDIGTKVHIKGGKLLAHENDVARKGTIISITNLFYNTPARLKFLKSESSELSQCVYIIEKLALSHPQVSFTLLNNDKELIKTSGSNNILKVIHEIYGLNISSNMLSLEIHNDDFIVKGFIAKPEVLKSNRNHITTFVNNRLVKNIDINKAINDAYYTYKPSDKYPVAVLYIETDPTLMDVNIHPTKQDIKLSKINDLYNLIYNGIKELLFNSLLIPKVKAEEIQSDDINVINIDGNEEINIVQNELDFSYGDEVIVNYVEEKKLVLFPTGLFHGTYIGAENEDGIYLIDQHAAQERINYEKYLQNLKDKKLNIKEMLFPVTVEFLKSDYIKFKEQENLFKDLGFIYDELGINTIVVKSHPDFLKEGYEEESIRKIIDLIIALGKEFDRVKFEEKIAITLACKMSIKANQKISMMEMEYILNELVKCSNPYNCPHGRPTIISFTNYELEKLFKRVV